MTLGQQFTSPGHNVPGGKMYLSLVSDDMGNVGESFGVTEA
jgi:hypothetical protein